MAKAHYYGLANSWHVAGSGLALAFALVSPFVLLYRPNWGPTLGAIAGLWIFASRLLLEPVSHRYQTKGAVAQEEFDCAVLGLEWNDALVKHLPEEDLHAASKSCSDQRRRQQHENWYPTDAAISWPISVITCQRANAVWARRQHFAYAIFLFVASAAWAVFGVALALQQKSTLAAYLTTVALPSLPALLDATETARRQLHASGSRLVLEQAIAQLDPAGVDRQVLRELQDQIFELRRGAPAVARWFYRVVRARYEEEMRYAAAQKSDDGGS